MIPVHFQFHSQGVGTLIFSYIRRLGPFGGFQIIFLILLFFFLGGGGGGQKKDYFGGNEDFVDIFGGHHKMVLYLGVILCILGSFLKVNV